MHILQMKINAFQTRIQGADHVFSHAFDHLYLNNNKESLESLLYLTKVCTKFSHHFSIDASGPGGLTSPGGTYWQLMLAGGGGWRVGAFSSVV